MRPAGSTEPVEPRPADGQVRKRWTRGPHYGTAHQVNADGDSATFESRLSQLTAEERRALDELRRRDQEVRAHEAAHHAAAGSLAASGPAYERRTGPDGREYAVGGHVKIDTSPGRTPEETIAKAQRIRQAALAPAHPSGQDLAVAAKAARMEAQARQQLARQNSADSGKQAGRPGMGKTGTGDQPDPVTGVGLDVFA